jgi:hypothetical protein
MPREAPRGTLASWHPDWGACNDDLLAFEHLLLNHAELSERTDILPFFRAHADLTALLGTYHPNIVACNRLGLEVPLFGEYIADAIVGDVENNALCLIEFEDGRSSSVFKPRRRRGTEWSDRLEHGFSQIVDWFWLFEDQQATLTFAVQFGERSPNVEALLIVGRDSGVSLADRRRLSWRSRRVQVGGQRVVCCTFDDALRRVRQRLAVWPRAAMIDGPADR